VAILLAAQRTLVIQLVDFGELMEFVTSFSLFPLSKS
jgi:hypothetical protein